MSVPSGMANLQFQTSGGTGDGNLYVRYGSAPSLTTWDCRPLLTGNSETCSFASPAAGTWHVLLNGASAYSGVTLTGSYQTAPPPCNSISDVEPNNSMSVPQVISGNCNQISGTFLNDPTPTGNYNYDFYRVSLPAGATVTALLNALSTDYDIELYDAVGNYVGWSYNTGTTPEQVSWTNTTSSAMNVYVLIYRHISMPRATYQLRVSY